MWIPIDIGKSGWCRAVLSTTAPNQSVKALLAMLLRCQCIGVVHCVLHIDKRSRTTSATATLTKEPSPLICISAHLRFRFCDSHLPTALLRIAECRTRRRRKRHAAPSIPFTLRSPLPRCVPPSDTLWSLGASLIIGPAAERVFQERRCLRCRPVKNLPNWMSCLTPSSTIPSSDNPSIRGGRYRSRHSKRRNANPMAKGSYCRMSSPRRSARCSIGNGIGRIWDT